MKKLLIWDFPDDFTPPEDFDRYKPREECFKCPFLYESVENLDPDEYERDYDIDEEIPYEDTIYYEYFCKCDIANGSGPANVTELCPLYDLFYD